MANPKSWGKELLISGAWTIALALAFLFLFVMLGGFHGSGGAVWTVATAPIGLLQVLGVGDGIFAGICALIAEFGSYLAIVLVVRAVWRKFDSLL
ncbi:MAG TPA: hypothetical protein VGI93_09285 [Steroidobacteraceae bacterium]|jgi:hypothetical protein